MKGNLNIVGPLSLIHSITEQFSRLSMEHIRSVSLCFCLNTKKQTRATNKALWKINRARLYSFSFHLLNLSLENIKESAVPVRMNWINFFFRQFVISDHQRSDPFYRVWRQTGRRRSDGGCFPCTVTCLLTLTSAACLASLVCRVWFTWSSCENSSQLSRYKNPSPPLSASIIQKEVN